jgi:serine/threonine-protein kinase
MGADLRGQLQAALGTRFTIERELEGGGMSRVYLADEIALGRRIVIKVLPPELGAGVSAGRFSREIQLAAKLQHPNIVPLLASGVAAGLLFYTMPYVEGESLAGRLKRERQLPLDDALRITRETAQALQYAHDRGVVHRDVKPGNILLAASHALVTDFGIALALDAAASDRITETGISVGTPTYMSPEQAAGQPADRRSDVYSLGCVLYEMLAGEPPFTGPSARSIIAKRLAGPPPRVSVVRRTVPGPVEEVLLTALATSPVDRYQTVAAFAEALDAAALDAPVAAARSLDRGLAPRNRWRVVAGAAIALAVITAASMVGYKRRGADTAISPERLAVLPFTTHGGGGFTRSLGDGMADLLSRKLDGLQRIRAVDPNVVIGRIRHAQKGSALDADGARDVARALGAGLYVTGSVHVVGARLRLQAALFSQRDGATSTGASAMDSSAITRASVEGDTAQLFTLVDQLAADLVARRYRGPGNRLVETAASTTHSLTALRAYLDAEGHLRSTRFDSAAIDYQRAIAADSGFALAYYRFAVALGLQSDWARAAPAAARALAFTDRLGDRERRLVQAFGAFTRGEADVAERAYRSLLAEYPDDLEARFLLGRTLFYYNPSRGRPIAEARPVFDEMLAADPEFLCPI